MAKSVTELLSSQNEQQTDMLNHMENQPAPYADMPENESGPAELSTEAASVISEGFENSTSQISNTIKQQSDTLKQQGQKLDSIFGVLTDQFAYQRKQDLRVDPTIQKRSSVAGNAGEFGKPKSMDIKTSEGGGLLGSLLGLGGGLGLGSMLGGKGKGGANPTGKPKAGKTGRLASLFSKFKAPAAGAATLAAGAGLASSNKGDTVKPTPKSGILSKLKGFAKGGGGVKGKLLMAALAGTAGLIGLDWFSDRQKDIQDSLYGIDNDKPEGESGSTIGSVGVLGAAAAGTAGLAALASKFGVEDQKASATTHAADAKAKITKSAADVAKSGEASKQMMKSSQNNFSKLVSEQTSKLKQTVSSVTAKVNERFSSLKEKFTNTETKVNKVSDVAKKTVKETSKSTSTTKEILKDSGKTASKTGPVSKASSAAKGGTKALGKGISKAIPGLGIALEGYDLYNTVSDETVSDKDKAKAVARTGGGLAGAAGGAALGAAAGSVVPVLGTALGGIAGGIAGYFGGGAITDLVTDKLSSAVHEAGVGDAIGRAVAVPMSLFSEDARKALDQDINENVKPKIDEYKSSVKNFFGLGEEKDKLDKESKVLSASSVAAASNATNSTNTVSERESQTKSENKNSTNNVVTPLIVGGAATIAGTAASTFNTFNKNKERETVGGNEGGMFFSTPAMTSSSPRIKPETTKPKFSALNKKASGAAAVVSGNAVDIDKSVMANSKSNNNMFEGDSNQNIANAGPTSSFAKNETSETKSADVYHVNNGITNNNTTVQNFNKDTVPEKTSKGQYEAVKRVMMVEDNLKVKQSKQSFPRPGHMKSPASAEGSYKPTVEDIPTIVSDFGLMFINNGFL